MTPPMADMDKACMGYAMCPDALTDEKKAMASVNGKMVVKSSHDALLVPLWMDPAPNGVGVTAGQDNMPFQNVDWKAMQSEVIGMGVTFRATRVSVGAGQEEVPASEVMHITCGPFACSEASMEKPAAPEITVADSAVCAAWDPNLRLQFGKIDNDLYFPRSGGPTGPPHERAFYSGDDGIDVGWMSSSNVAMTVKHKFAGIEYGKTYSVSGPDAPKGSNKPLPMDFKDNAEWGEGIRFMKVPDGGGEPAKTARLADNCQANYESLEVGVLKPNSCFRMSVGGLHQMLPSTNNPNYLSGYRVEVSAKDSSVSWGKVKWKEDPFKDLKCAPVTFMAADQVDVCDLLEEEVDQALAEGWGAVTFPTSGTGANTSAAGPLDGGAKLRNWEVKPKSATSRRFKRLWFDDNLNGKIRNDPGPKYEGASNASQEGGFRQYRDFYHFENDMSSGLRDAYRALATGGQFNFIWMTLMDPDGDPTMGDFGKVDLYGKDSTPDSSGNDNKLPDGKADNYPSPDDAEKCTNADNDADDEICDARWEMDYDVLFTDGIFGCEATRTVTISCEWDAQGLIKDNPPDEANGNLAATASADNRPNVENFAKCTAK